MLLSESPRKSFISSVIRLLVTVTYPFIAKLVALDAHNPNFFVPYSDIVSMFDAFHTAAFRGHHVRHSFEAGRNGAGTSGGDLDQPAQSGERRGRRAAVVGGCILDSSCR